jgi:FkbM family methyltransferase
MTTMQEIGGTNVVVPLLGNTGFDNLSPSERWLTTWLSRLLKDREGVFVDIGVNVGQTLLKVKTLFPHVQYVGFEPNAVCFHYTQRLVELNGFEHCTLLPVGLSNRTALIPCFMRHEHDVSASVVAGFRPLWKVPERMYVAVFDGDAVLEQLEVGRVAVVKIDVEGGELEVVEGLRKTIGRDRPLIFCEILPLYPEDPHKLHFRQPRQERLLADLRQLGYVMYRLLEDGTAVSLTDIEPHGNVKLTNYLFAPVEDAALIARAAAEGTTSG